MSLKAIHVVFILACLGLAVGVGVWAFGDYAATGSRESFWLGIFCVVLGVATIPYAVWFVRKLRRVSYL